MNENEINSEQQSGENDMTIFVLKEIYGDVHYNEFIKTTGKHGGIVEFATVN